MRQEDVRSLKFKPEDVIDESINESGILSRKKGRSFTFRPKTSAFVFEDSAIAVPDRIRGSEVEYRVWFSREPVMRNEVGFKYMLMFISRDLLNST